MTIKFMFSRHNDFFSNESVNQWRNCYYYGSDVVLINDDCVCESVIKLLLNNIVLLHSPLSPLKYVTTFDVWSTCSDGCKFISQTDFSTV